MNVHLDAQADMRDLDIPLERDVFLRSLIRDFAPTPEAEAAPGCDYVRTGSGS